MKKPITEEQLTNFLKKKKSTLHEDRNIMAQIIVSDHGRLALKHVLAGSPLEAAVKAEMKSKGILNVEDRNK